jgi:ATP-binding cassette, subfamily B, bacterial
MIRARIATLRAAPATKAFAELLGHRKRRVTALAAASLLSGLSEGGILAVVAQVAGGLATGTRTITLPLGPTQIDTSLGGLLVAGACLVLARFVLQGPLAYIPARISADTQARLRRTLFDAFTRASWHEQAQDREGHLQELMGTHVQQVTVGTVQATTLVTNLVGFLVLLAAALVLDPLAAVVVLAFSLGLFAAMRPLNSAGARYAREWSQAQLEQAGGVSEAARLAEETQVFGVGDVQRKRIDGLIEKAGSHYFRAQLASGIGTALYPSFVFMLLVGGLAVVYEFVGSGLTSLAAVVLVLVRAAGYGNNVQAGYQSVRQAIPFVERLHEEEERYRRNVRTRGSRPLASVETLAFEDVSFGYRDDTVLEHLTFEVGEGEAIGVAGPSGAGKSTLAQLLLQLRVPTSGRYLVNREPADAYRLDDWHRMVAFVPQTPNLIHASVADNIRYLRTFSDEDVERAARLAGVHDDVTQWRDGYDTIVGPRADAVSGGQAQRICLARALVSAPKLLLLDEPTSAVDLRSEQLIQESLVGLKGQVTLFIIAHRLSTLDMCDRTMILLDGRLDAFVPVSQLREQSAYYRSLTANLE